MQYLFGNPVLTIWLTCSRPTHFIEKAWTKLKLEYLSGNPVLKIWLTCSRGRFRWPERLFSHIFHRGSIDWVGKLLRMNHCPVQDRSSRRNMFLLQNRTLHRQDHLPQKESFSKYFDPIIYKQLKLVIWHILF